jgi:tetratricopeptide (TPR) repeat protein
LPSRVYQQERYAEAIQFCDRALEIDANYEWAIYQRGYAYLLMKQYDLAIQAFDQAIALAPEDDWTFYCRAIAHLALNHPGAADTDIVRAIDLAQTQYDQDPTDWRNTFNLALYHLVADHFDLAEALYRNAKVEASRDRIEAAQRDLQDFLSLFPDHAIAQRMVTLLEPSG